MIIANDLRKHRVKDFQQIEWDALVEEDCRALVRLAVREDLERGQDWTTVALVPADRQGAAGLVMREPGIVAGMPAIAVMLDEMQAQITPQLSAADGQRVEAGSTLARLEGNVRDMLTCERTLLNLLSRLMGVATLTGDYVDQVQGTSARIYDTRKTLPGWRALDKYATAVGGAMNHRAGLFDGILLKDNHIAAAGGTELAVKAALSRASAGLRIQVEVETHRDAEIAIGAGADFLLLDNIPIEEMQRIVKDFGERAILEASGGVTIENVRSVAETGVHRISVGALTHSANAVDVALEISEGRNATGGATA